MATVKADNSLEDQVSEIRGAFDKQFNPSQSSMAEYPPHPYVIDTKPDYVIISMGSSDGEHFKVAYTVDAATNEPVFVSRDQWQPVEKQESWIDTPAASIKAGARHSTSDMKTGAAAKAKALGIVSDLENLGFVETQANATKADGLPNGLAEDFSVASIKAVGDRQLQIKIAFTRDSHGERFDQKRTDFDVANFPSPPMSYYHGYNELGQQTAKPIFIGRTVARETKADGHYIVTQLDNSTYADKVWDAALKGQAVASPGGIRHLIRKAHDGTLTYWPIGEIAAWDYKPGDKKSAPANLHSVATPYLKALYQQADIALPGIADEAPESSENHSTKNEDKMTQEEIDALFEKKLAERDAKQAADLKMAEDRKAADAALIETERQKWEAEAVKSNRLPYREGGQAPAQARFGDVSKYEHLNLDDLAFLAGTLGAEKDRRPQSGGISKPALKALAIRISEDKSEMGETSREDLKAAGINPSDVVNAVKANELNYSTQAGYGDEWVGVEYSRRLWNNIRNGSFVVAKLDPGSVIIPEGVESMVIPLEGADPTWYKVGQTTDLNATTGLPNATIPASKLATGNKTLTSNKMGARVVWSGEMEEDSMVPWVPNLRRQLEQSGSEQMEHAIIDGDTTLTASTNINDIAGTPAGTEIFTLVDGFRKLPLVTNTANSVSASGSLVDTDFLAAMFLLGTAGKNAQDMRAVDFIVDPNTARVALGLPSFKTKDVNSNATIENGRLTNAWGYGVLVSYFMHYMSAVLKANTAGKVDQDTTANNTRGAILAVRWDQWLLGYKRKMKIETGRLIESDSTQIVATVRWGLAYRDIEASAIVYNVGL